LNNNNGYDKINVEAESPEDYFRKVVLDGYSSEESSVISGVPQGTVLGPLMFLLYVNDIAD
jgi:hypothetical protein